MTEEDRILRWLGHFLFYIGFSLLVSFIEYKITGYSWERFYVYTFLGVLAAEVSTLHANKKEK